MNAIHRSAFPLRWLLLAFTAAVAVAAQGQTNTIIHPTRTFTGPTAVIDSTLNVFPQINPSHLSQPRMSSENEDGPPVRTGTPNNLIASSLSTSTPSNFGAMFPGIGFTGWVPPDPNIAVGPQYIVETVNSDIAFFQKSNGSKVFQQAMSPTGFFSGLGATSFIFDPKCFYDQVSGRFFVIALEEDDASKVSKCLVAVSDDNNPNGTWFKYRIEAKMTISGSDCWLDYPGWGYNKDAIVITGNMFAFGDGYQGTQIIVLSKAQMLTGGAPTITSFLGNGFTIQPCRTLDPVLDKVYAVGQDTTTSLAVYCIQNLLNNPTIVRTTLAVPAFQNAGLAQSTGGGFLDTLYPRCLTAYYRSGKIVTAHTCGTANSQGKNVARWYDIKVNTWPASGAPTLNQSGNILNVNANFFQPAICVNKFGDISMIFSACNTSVAADIYIASRKTTDPLGSMGNPIKLGSSTGNPQAGGNRWGDYFATVVDPTDDATFWGVCQTVVPGGAWTTQFFKWTVTTSGGGGGATVIPPSNVSIYGGQGNIISGTLSSITSSDDQYLDVQATLNPVLGYVAAIELTFNTNKPPAKVTSLTFTNEAITNYPVNATGMFWVYNWTTGAYDHKMSYTIPYLGNAQVQLPITNFTNYVSATGQVKIVFRGLTPITSGTNTRPFDLLEDFCKLEGNFLP